MGHVLIFKVDTTPGRYGNYLQRNNVYKLAMATSSGCRINSPF